MTSLEPSDALALAGALERVQQLLCSPHITDDARHNAIAGVVHRALIDHGGGYSAEAVEARRCAAKAAL